MNVMLSVELHVGNSQAQSTVFLTATAAATATTDAWLSIRLWYGTIPIFNVSALLSALPASYSTPSRPEYEKVTGLSQQAGL